MLKKQKNSILALFLIFIMIISLFSCSNPFANNIVTETDESIKANFSTELSTIAVTENFFINIECDAPFAIFYNLNSDKILFQKDIHHLIAPASLTKLLTACVALKYVPSDTVFNVGNELDLVPQGSSLCLISQGQKLTLYDLLIGMLLASGNDASYTVAVNVARYLNPQLTLSNKQAVEYFVKLMNSFAAEIEMNNSNFSNPCGWDNDEQFTTIHDLLLLSKFAFNVSEIREIVKYNKRYVVFQSGENITWINSNKLLNPNSRFYCEDAIGMKTGTTNKAGRCLIGIFSKNNNIYIGIVSGCDSDTQRYTSLLDLYNKIKKLS